MLPRTSSIWQRDSQPTASGKPGAVQTVSGAGARGQGLYHRYNAALKRALGNKSRAEMTVAELEAAVGWLERNRLADHLHLLEGDARYAWTARQRAEWRPPVGRARTRSA